MSANISGNALNAILFVPVDSISRVNNITFYLQYRSEEGVGDHYSITGHNRSMCILLNKLYGVCCSEIPPGHGKHCCLYNSFCAL